MTLPVSAEDTDSFIATLPLVSPPGLTFVYNNCGYYLLGRVVNKLRGTSRPIDAYQKHLFDPLQITRIRRAKDLIADQEPGEARYQDPDAQGGHQRLSGRKTGAELLWHDHLEIMDGDGGLTGAAVDVARLVAILTSSGRQSGSEAANDRRSMFTRGVRSRQANNHRAGYGFDALR